MARRSCCPLCRGIEMLEPCPECEPLEVARLRRSREQALRIRRRARMGLPVRWIMAPAEDQPHG